MKLIFMIWKFAFQPADNLWTAFQKNIVNFIEDHGGQASKIDADPERVNWEDVQDYLMGN